MSSSSVSLIVGLGNPGPEYASTWHNFGFTVVDAFREAESYQFAEWTTDDRGTAQIARSLLPHTRLLLAKPQTLMNNSGLVVAELLREHRLRPDNLWVIHDDLDLPLGKVRLSRNASAGGHRGVQSIVDALSTTEFTRFRLGIGTPEGATVAAETYVLQAIPASTQTVVREIVQRTLEAIMLAQLAGVAEAMNQYN